ncbi:MAG: 4Fe-4S dicluster domain-containing protein [Chitinophagaceae bacterium]|nr:4Fe-4S dicluster domain-containing protein [Oligoflexus sp.]
MALAGVTACTVQKPENIITAVRAPEDRILSGAEYFATTLTKHGFAVGVLGETHLGRPTKLEGNPDHPASLGAATADMQATILELYDPDRAKKLRFGKEARTWESVAGFFKERRAEVVNFHIVCEPTTSPTFLSQMARLRKVLPNLHCYSCDPFERGNTYKALDEVFGAPNRLLHKFEKARCIVAVDCDFLAEMAQSLRYSHDFAEGRRIRSNRDAMNRLYAIETSPGLVGGMADFRLALKPSEYGSALNVLANDLGLTAKLSKITLTEGQRRWVSELAVDLKKYRGESILIAGDRLSSDEQALVLLINNHLGNLGKTIEVLEPAPDLYHTAEPLTNLMSQLGESGKHVLIIIGANPVYSMPGDIDFPKVIAKADWSMHLNVYEDETSQYCQWFIPQAHVLESWGDAYAYDGTISFVQPLIRPLYQGKTATELLSLILGETNQNAFDVMRAFWKKEWSGIDFEKTWQRSVRSGIVFDSKSKSLKAYPIAIQADSLVTSIAAKVTDSYEVQFKPDPVLADGTMSNNAWLQELPKPFSKLTWDNAVYLSPKTARELKLLNGDVIEISSPEGKQLVAPVWIQPGQAEKTLTLFLGYGRSRAGRVGNGVGYDVASLRSQKNLHSISGVTIRKMDASHVFASTQSHTRLEQNMTKPSPHFDWLDYSRRPESVHSAVKSNQPETSLIPRNPRLNAIESGGKEAWGMTIDLNTCTGCNACVIACQAENNIPSVGKDQVLLGREMQWMRIDQYYEGSEDDPQFVHQPVTCMQCENAPCETVCPVGATVHSAEGINEMVYNRCVGTRYCSNNCPYKVRHFNFLDYNDMADPGLQIMRNPDVTVRAKGVMEKCTYCIQRVNRTRIESEKSGIPVGPNELMTACQQTCSVQAIVFGNLNDPKSGVFETSRSPLRHEMLAELNVKPRTGYLVKFFNRNRQG